MILSQLKLVIYLKIIYLVLNNNKNIHKDLLLCNNQDDIILLKCNKF